MAKMRYYKKNKVVMYLGQNGMGKTTLIKGFLDEWQSKNPKGTIWKYDPAHSFSDYRNVKDIGTYFSKGSKKRRIFIRNSVILFHDFTDLYLSSKDFDIKYLLSHKNKCNGNTIIIADKSIKRLPLELKDFASKYFLCRTDLDLREAKQFFSFAPIFILALHRVRQYWKFFSNFIVHPDSPEFRYTDQTFPYIKIETGKKSIINFQMVNMDRGEIDLMEL